MSRLAPWMLVRSLDVLARLPPTAFALEAGFGAIFNRLALAGYVSAEIPSGAPIISMAARSAKGSRRNPSLWKLRALKETIEAKRQELWKRIDEIHALIFRLKDKSVELAAAGETPKIDLLAAREMLVAESDRLMAEIVALENGKSPEQGDA